MSLDVDVELIERYQEVTQCSDVFIDIDELKTGGFRLTGSLQALIYGSEQILYQLLPFCFHLRPLILQSSKERLDIPKEFLLFTNQLAIASDYCICLSPVVEAEEYHFGYLFHLFLQLFHTLLDTM